MAQKNKDTTEYFLYVRSKDESVTEEYDSFNSLLEGAKRWSSEDYFPPAPTSISVSIFRDVHTSEMD